MPFLIFLVLMGSVFVWYDPKSAVTMDALIVLGRGIGVASFWFLACLRMGSRLVGFFQREKPWDVCFVLGLGFWGLCSLFLIIVGCFHHIGVGILLVFFLVGGQSSERIRLTTGGWMCLGLAFCWGLIDAWAPVIDVDAVYYHLALPKQMWLHGELLGGVFHPNGSRPLILHLPYGMLFGWGGENAVSFFHLFIALTLLASLLERGEKKGTFVGIWSVVLLLGTWSFIHKIGVVANNIPAGLACWLAYVLCREKKYMLAAGIAGIGLSIKFTALGILAGIWLFWIQGLRNRINVLLVVLCVVIIWPIRNIFEGVHPLFPYMGWEGDFPFQYLEKYGAGRDWASMLMFAIPAEFAFAFCVVCLYSPRHAIGQLETLGLQEG